jgi:fructose-1,6-bisphosphatase/inositol monophosphatase family enzyme
LKLNILEDVGEMLRAIAATVVMPRFAFLQAGEIELKAANEPVTVADREAEAAIGYSLRSIHPSARIIGEEACHADPSLLRNLGDGLVWIIDPIDGTANFAAGRPPFAMMVALLQDGETIGSWILDPLSGRLAVAEKGGGAWIDGQRVQTSSDPADLGTLEGIVSGAFIPPNLLGLPDKLCQAVSLVHPTARCAGHEYPLVATGSRHFALYWRTLVWDHAPGALLLTEAGGSVTYLDGAPYRPPHSVTGLLIAHNPLIAQAILGVVQAKT